MDFDRSPAPAYRETGGAMRKGDTVRVWPYGRDGEASLGKVLSVSSGARAIVVSFGENPAFRSEAGQVVNSGHGVMLLAMRQAPAGEPWGPWIDLFGSGYYEIEARGKS